MHVRTDSAGVTPTHLYPQIIAQLQATQHHLALLADSAKIAIQLLEADLTLLQARFQTPPPTAPSSAIPPAT